MPASISPTEDDIFIALRAMILTLLGSIIPVIRGMDNRVPMPEGGFVLLTEVGAKALATNTFVYGDPYPSPGTRTVGRSTQFTIQIDCYGPLASLWANTLSILLRDEYACVALAPVCQPLYTTDPRMMPLVNGEEQYEHRYSFDAVLNYNPAIVLPQEFAGKAEVGVINVDEAYPP